LTLASSASSLAFLRAAALNLRTYSSWAYLAANSSCFWARIWACWAW
jgi:hypothetical protein